MKTALITLSDAGARLLAPLAGLLPEAGLFVHESVREEALRWGPAGIPDARDGAPRAGDRAEPGPAEAAAAGNAGPEAGGATGPEGGAAPPAAERFSRIADLTATLFPHCRELVFAAPCGVVVRAIAPLAQSKYRDPAVVVLDAGGRWAVSLLSGHEGGANDLAIRIANLTGAEPVVTTTTEALKTVIVGVGCRRGTEAAPIVAAVRAALAGAGVSPEEVRLIASADLKAGEAGLLEAARALEVPVRFLAAEEIRASSREFARSGFVQAKVALPAVAEPAALLAGRRTRLICARRAFNGITVALAREELPSTGIHPGGPQEK